MFVTMFAATPGAGALGFTTLSGQQLDMQRQIGDLRTELHQAIGDPSERMARVVTLIQTHPVPHTAVPPPAGP